MLLLLALSVLSVATVGSVLVYQKQATLRLKAPEDPLELPPPPAEERTFESLQIGDVVSWGDDDWVVQQRATYLEEGEIWWLYALDEGTGQDESQVFLEVRRHDGTEVAFFHIANDAPLFGQLSHGLTFRGQSFLLESRGDAVVALDARADDAGLVAGRLRYSRYRGPGGLWLTIEENNGERRAYAGETVAKKTIGLMPGNAASVRRTRSLEDELDGLVDDVERRRT